MKSIAKDKSRVPKEGELIHTYYKWECFFCNMRVESVCYAAVGLERHRHEQESNGHAKGYLTIEKKVFVS